jgi:hypothetical protein
LSYFTIWKDKIVLYPSVKLSFLTHPNIAPRVKFNEKFNGYLLKFSAQNLKRLRMDFGDKIEPKKCQSIIDDLKIKKAMFDKSVQLAMEIKQGLHDHVQLPYKLPPLGLYQHRGVLLQMMVPILPFFPDCGMGKGNMTLVSTENQIKQGIIKKGKVLVAGKLATLFSGWKEDAEKFTDLKVEILWAKS